MKQKASNKMVTPYCIVSISPLATINKEVKFMKSVKSFLMDLERQDILNEGTKHLIGSATCLMELECVISCGEIDHLLKTSQSLIKHYLELASEGIKQLKFIEDDEEDEWAGDDEAYLFEKNTYYYLNELQEKLLEFSKQIELLNRLMSSLKSDAKLQTEYSLKTTLDQIIGVADLEDTFYEIGYAITETYLEKDQYDYFHDELRNVIYSCIADISEICEDNPLNIKNYLEVKNFLYSTLAHFAEQRRQNESIFGTSKQHDGFEPSLSRILELHLDTPFYLTTPEGGNIYDKARI